MTGPAPVVTAPNPEPTSRTTGRRKADQIAGTRAAVPRLLWVPAVIGIALLLLPLVGLIAKADWATLPAALVSADSLNSLKLSLITSVLATLICVVLGAPMALVLARRQGGWIRLLRILVTLPLVLPPTVGGIALLYLLGRNGLLGNYLFLWFGIRIPFTTTAVVISESFVALPFLVLALEGTLRTAGTAYETVAATLGAGRWTVFRRVTLPLVGPGLSSATILCFARALGEFGATALFAGNNSDTRTMPIAIYSAFNGASVDESTAVALALLLVVVAGLILAVARPWRPGNSG